ncbi:ABC transporter substrate-binding protein [Pyrobaculum ferrireducens]|uniref:Extracellular solute-binding protein, family 5 n=1 Tax=Pyrobaculum ferrireducens TaxID=1104324 RepID=G7VDP8_9CREN|nr:ABC transporter substrate-binding protein [Pyrobaculum ferrireducens]AET34027.1 extracellular solute-binding protein, family 5 [Pyrobaculum ferrireducens]
MPKVKGISKGALAGIVIALVLIAAAAVLLMQPKAPPTTTPTTTPPTTTPQTTPTTTQTTTPTTPQTTQTTTATTPSPTATQTTTSPSPTATAPQKVFHKNVIYIINNDATARIQLYKTGTADIAAVPLDRLNEVVGTKMGNYMIELREDPNLLTLTIEYIVLNANKEPFNNPLVRQALAWAVPYDAILSRIYANRYARLYAVIPKGLPGYTDYGIVKYTYNITKAQELIKKSGIDPTKYTIVIDFNLGNDQRAQTAALLANAWARLGFKVTTEPLNWPTLLSKTEKGDFDVYIIGWLPDYLDPDDYASPLFYGGTRFKTLDVVEGTAQQISSMLSSAKVFDVGEAVVVVGPKGSGAKAEVPAGKKIYIVAYEVDLANTKPVNASTGFVDINPAFYRNYDVDAMIVAARTHFDPMLREALYKAISIASNVDPAIIWLGQAKFFMHNWNWVKGRYYTPLELERYDLLWETPDAPVVSTGIKDYKNGPDTYVIATIGWPQSFDPAASYESFGWEIFTQIGTTLVTFWRENTEYVVPSGAVAWAHDENGTTWYFVIRGGMKAYEPWNNKVYDIDAVDVLFSIWRIARLSLDPSWMITTYVDVNASSVLTEDEFKQVLSKGLVTEYAGKSYNVKSWDDLMKIFGYSGPTAGVVKLELTQAYPAILPILAAPFTMIVSMQYALGDKYQQALADSNNGKNPAAWAKYVTTGEDDATHRLLHEKPISTGPYYVADYQQDSYIVLKYNPYYWNATLWQQLYGFKP